VIVVCDSTILIGLAKIGRLELLEKVFSKISFPEEVFRKLVEKGAGKQKEGFGAKSLNEVKKFRASLWNRMEPCYKIVKVKGTVFFLNLLYPRSAPFG
jgi:predicted nucleic acid-binding protein